LGRRLQDKWSVRSLRPAGARWLKLRTERVPFHTARFVTQARVERERLRLRCNDGTERLADHVVLGTGYRINIARYPFLPAEIMRRIDLVDGYPRLGAGFESTLPGLHFLGAPAAWSYGPLLKFVAGTAYSGKELRRGILKAKHPLRNRQPAADLTGDQLSWHAGARESD
jgi:hypothetical protein